MSLRSVLGYAVWVMTRPVVFLLGSDLWAFNALCLGYVYCVWKGIFDANLARVVGTLLGTLAFVTAVSTKLFETPTRAKFREDWRRHNDLRHGFTKPTDAAEEDWELVGGDEAKDAQDAQEAKKKQ